MSLQREFEAEGNWLFRWRSYLPFVLLVPLCVAMKAYEWPLHSYRLHEWWEAFCLAVSFGGLGVRVLVVGFTPRGTSGRNTHCQIAEALNTGGLYSLVRHPLYVGNFLIWAGIAMFALTWWLLAIYVLAFWLYYERIMFAEEAFLRRRFGDQFVEWAAKTPPFVPRFSRWRRPALPFCWRTVLRREYTGFFGICVAFVLLEFAEHWIVERSIAIETHWIVLGALGSLVYVVLRTLRKRTRVLQITGR
ncbi:MAG: DUF1295 domain-containing protein [Rhodopirellula sp.]|nr:DUF1295 domain-containing protein [Rhodopirellula sp.]